MYLQPTEHGAGLEIDISTKEATTSTVRWWTNMSGRYGGILQSEKQIENVSTYGG